MKYWAIAFITALFTFNAHAAQKRYVSDELWLQLRSGPSTGHRILKAIPTGEHLIFLSEDANSGYTKVKTGKGLEGWVLTRFLSTEPAAKEKLIYANRKLTQLQAELDKTKEKLTTLETETKDLRSKRSTLSREQGKLQKELEHIKKVSENAVALDQKSKKLSQKNQELEIQVDTLRAENSQLQNDKRLSYFLYGGGLVIIGLIAGWILPSLVAGGGKRKGSEWV